MTLIDQIQALIKPNEMPVGFTVTVKKDCIIGIVVNIFHTDVIKSSTYQHIAVKEVLAVLIPLFENVWHEVKHHNTVYEITIELDKDPVVTEIGEYYFVDKEYAYRTFDIDNTELTEEDVADIASAKAYALSYSTLFIKDIEFEKITKNYEVTDEAIFFLDITGLNINTYYPLLSLAYSKETKKLYLLADTGEAIDTPASLRLNIKL